MLIFEHRSAVYIEVNEQRGTEKRRLTVSIIEMSTEPNKISGWGMADKIKGASMDDYHQLYEASIQDPEKFWAEQAEKYIDWQKSWDQVISGDFNSQDVRWFSGATLNVSANCIDRHLADRGDQVAIIWEGDGPSQSQKITYQALHEAVCRLANGLKSLGVTKGDRVCIYMPMMPEALFAMLACARIGAIHSVVFAGFSAESLKNRVNDASCKVIITADGNLRGGKQLPLKDAVDSILQDCPTVTNVIVAKYTNQQIQMTDKDCWYHELVQDVSTSCLPTPMQATDPLFILYTSGSTGKPKGILHGQGGYLLHVTMTFQQVFNYQPGDIFWCTADIGWITGHSYLLYGALSSGATTLVFAGVPTYPTPSRCWEIIDKHQVNIFYTAPTAIRSLMRAGDAFVKSSSRESLKLLGTVGEPIGAKAWQWYYDVVGDKRCPIVDTWWQTETGGIMITALPNATPLKPGSAGWPFFGVQPAIVDDNGNPLPDDQSGNLVIKAPWPGQCQTIYGDDARYRSEYFSRFPSSYSTGDAAYKDQEGYYWIAGRVDDVINVSGHRIDTAEIEGVVVTHPDIVESAVVGFPHEIKGQGIFVFATPKASVADTDTLKQALTLLVREKIGPIATPDVIYFTHDLPKTRSGKIMRRLLRQIVSHQLDDLGDTSTLINPESVKTLIKEISGAH